MANPAKLLHEVLAGWSVPPNTHVETVRGDAAAMGTWEVHARAAGFLKAIERALDGMEAMGEEVDHYREVLPAWYQAVFACSTPWSSLTTSHRYVVQPSDLRLLKALGGQLASVNYARPVAADQLAALLTHLDTTDELVRTSSDINDDVRRYMLGLISEARRVAKELQTFGDVELRTITFELGAAMLNVADTSVPEQNRQGWIDGAKGMLSRVAWKAGEKALESGSGAAIDAAMNAITG